MFENCCCELVGTRIIRTGHPHAEISNFEGSITATHLCDDVASSIGCYHANNNYIIIGNENIETVILSVMHEVQTMALQ